MPDGRTDKLNYGVQKMNVIILCNVFNKENMSTILAKKLIIALKLA